MTLRKTGFCKAGFSRDVKELAYGMFHGRCWLCVDHATELHHRIANTVPNNAKFPHLIQSVFNAAPLCRECHVQRAHELNFNNAQALVYEYALKTIHKGD